MATKKKSKKRVKLRDVAWVAAIVAAFFSASCEDEAQCDEDEVFCDDACMPETGVCCKYGNGTYCKQGDECGGTADSPTCDSPDIECGANECANILPDNSFFCCPEGQQYYCNGTGECYATYAEAYQGMNCTLPTQFICPN